MGGVCGFAPVFPRVFFKQKIYKDSLMIETNTFQKYCSDFDYHFIWCWKDVKILQWKYLRNRIYTTNGMLITANKLKLIWMNIKEPKSYDNVIKQISGWYP